MCKSESKQQSNKLPSPRELQLAQKALSKQTQAHEPEKTKSPPPELSQKKTKRTISTEDIKKAQRHISSDDVEESFYLHTVESAKLWAESKNYQHIQEVEIRYGRPPYGLDLPILEIAPQSPATNSSEKDVFANIESPIGPVHDKWKGIYPSLSWTSITYHDGLAMRVFWNLPPKDDCFNDTKHKQWREIESNTRRLLAPHQGLENTMYCALKLGRRLEKPIKRLSSEPEDTDHFNQTARGPLTELKHNLLKMGLLADSEYEDSITDEYRVRARESCEQEEIDLYFEETRMLQIAPELIPDRDPRMIWKLFYEAFPSGMMGIAPLDQPLSAAIWELANTAFLAGMAAQEGKMSEQGQKALRGQDMTSQKGTTHKVTAPIHEAIDACLKQTGEIPSPLKLGDYIEQSGNEDWLSAYKAKTDESLRGIIKRRRERLKKSQ